jgi:threonine aldolase
VALGRPATELADPFDSVMICLSKGLGAPVGSVVAGSSSFVGEALRVRKRLGGGMRQAGVIAAAGIIALGEHVERLAEDHAAARLLARRAAGIKGLAIDVGRVQTNIVIFEVVRKGLTAGELVERWKQAGVLALAIDDRHVRVVTHYDVGPSQLEAACDCLESVMREQG